MVPAGFPLGRRIAPPAELIAPTTPTSRAAWLCEPSSPAFVLGSTQDDASVDVEACRRRGIEVLRRRSGGGGVLVRPGAQVWLDVFVPSGDPLFEVDVARASERIGEVWLDALASLLDRDALELHRGSTEPTRFSRAWCFSGLGPGELRYEGRKLVGLAQRRSRAGAWFFTMAHYSTDPVADAALVALDGADRDALTNELATRVGLLGIAPVRVERALGEALQSR